MGYVETLHKNHLLLQANSIKHRAVLYYIYQGREVVDDDRYRPDAEGGLYIYSRLHLLVITIDGLA